MVVQGMGRGRTSRRVRDVWMPWRTAMEEALYGVDGFYRTAGAAARHFRTSVHVSPHFAGAIVRLLGDVDAALGRHGHLAGH